MGLGSRIRPKPILAPKVLVIDFRPAAVPQEWNNTTTLIQKYLEALRQASKDTLKYRVAKKLDVQKYPPLLGNRQYDDSLYTQVLQDDTKALRDAAGNYVMADYEQILKDFNVLPLILDKTIDEVWMFGGPYFGFYESRMIGKGAFWCNGPAIELDSRRFVVMGFNYQRDVREMVHDFGHRAESILGRHFKSQPYLDELYKPAAGLGSAPKNDFEQFLHSAGTVHRKPGGEDYGQDEVAWVTALRSEWFPAAVDPNRVK
jgi:hypothetical protein